MKRNTYKRIFSIALVLVFFIAINFFYKNFILDFQSRKNSFIKKVEHQILHKEKIADKILDLLINDSTSVSSEKIVFNEKILRISNEENITFLKYKNDSLVLWTDNYFSFPGLFDKNAKQRKVVQTENGWYYLIKKEGKQKTCFAAILIKNDYKYENDYLTNNFCRSLNSDITGVSISEKTNGDVITNSDGQKLFSLTFSENTAYSGAGQIILLLTGFCSFLALLYLFYLLYLLLYEKKRIGRTLFVFAYISTLLIFRSVFFYFKIPAYIYSTDLFGPLFYASSGWLPSFGDLLINAVLFFIIAVFIYKNTAQQSIPVKMKWVRYAGSPLIILFLAVLFYYIISLVRSIVLDSTISYNLSQLFTIDFLSITGLLIISLLILSFFFISASLLQVIQNFRNYVFFNIAIILVLGILPVILNIFGIKPDFPSVICFILFCCAYLLLRLKREKRLYYYEIFAYLIIFTFTVYYNLIITTNTKELEKRKSFAHKLSSGEDPLGEFIYKSVQEQIAGDNLLKEKLKEYPQSESNIKDYLVKKYFSGYWNKYKVQITVCNVLDSLLVESGTQKHNCKSFFDDVIATYGKPTTCPDLNMLNYGTGGSNYLSTLKFSIDSSDIYLFIELNSKFIPKGLGYPELLIDKKLFINTDLSGYSYAKYYKNGLIDAYGKYYYSTIFSIDSSIFVNDLYTFNSNGYNHLCYRPDSSSLVMISKKNGNILDILAPFSILFTFFSIVILIYSLFEIILPNRRTIRFNFKNRLQLSMVSIIVISFLIIGISTFYFIRSLNENKNLDLLSEKTMSIMMALQNKLGDNNALNDEQLNALNNSLIKYSNVFFTDINVFDGGGKLISSSRPQIFMEGLLSERMNPHAYYQLITQKKTLFIQKENIGKLNYYSAYVPFFGRSNKILYYINLPYFAKEGELKRELSSFLTTFVNIYVILIAITIIIALFIAGRISRPLKVIREKLGNIKLGKKNEKILWKGRDEIGELISEYNRMLDELAESAEILSRSERESAWRVMAMQVAHEIKNPLTPMKLSVQHLERSYKDHAPDWDKKLERFTKNIIEQIDNLSTIAAEFSYFAQMPKPKNEKIDLTALIADAMSIFMSHTGVEIVFEQEKNVETCWVFVDKKQLIRVMNNILSNAIHAIGDRNNGLIEIKTEQRELTAIISIKDNGSGISEEMKPMIFTPNFSTKSEGMGLGLAIVKGIIENSGGHIWFESELEEGTTFFIELPLYNKNI